MFFGIESLGCCFCMENMDGVPEHHEFEYGAPSKARLKRERQVYKEAEVEDREHEYII